MDTFSLSEEQNKVCKFIRTGIGNAFIEAYAGSGKSTTLLGCIKEIKPDKSVVMIAHNVDVVKHLRKKIDETVDGRSTTGSGWKMTKVVTYHSLGYHIIKENMEKLGLTQMPEPNDRKYVKYINEHIEELAGEGVKNLRPSEVAVYKSNLLFLVDFCRHNINQSEKDIKKTLNQFKITTVLNEEEAIRKCLIWGKTHLDVIDFQDMVWLPYELRLQTKQFVSDFVFVDEAQDTSRAQFELFKKCIKRNTRYVAVGDEHQTINMWCGSDRDSFQKFGSLGGKVTRFTLSTSFRCGRRIIAEAQKIVPGICPADNKPNGVVNYHADPDDIKPGDMILCRNGAPLMAMYLRLIREGKKAYIQGEAHTYNATLAFVNSLNAKTVGELAYNAQSTLIELWERIANDFNESLEESSTNGRVIAMYDLVQTVLSIASYCTTIDEVIETIKNAQFDESKKSEDAIMMSTIHRAKGLEKENVYILCPELIPSRLAVLDWEIKSEQNLIYVMITRAINSLNFIPSAEADIDYAMESPIAMYHKLNYIKKNLHFEN